MSKILIACGIALVVLGLALTHAPWLVNWFGRLPGDINFVRGNTRIFFPITSLIVVSIVVSVVVNVFFRR
jgi:hypothetical protein